jgi:uncharacterized protein YndB with AHSA1/START domain
MSDVTAPKAIIEGHSIRRSIRVNASPAAVWAAITEPEQIAQWFGDSATFTGFEVGATGVYGWEGHGEFPVLITEIEPLAVFAVRWAGEPTDVLRDDDSTTIRMTIEEDGDVTVLTVVESGFENVAGGTAYRRRRLQENKEGWNEELDELAAYLERA